MSDCSRVNCYTLHLTSIEIRPLLIGIVMVEIILIFRSSPQKREIHGKVESTKTIESHRPHTVDFRRIQWMR